MFKEEKAKSPKSIETTIGPTVKVEGDFTSQGDIIVEGVVQGNLKTKGRLRIGSVAKITADVEALSAYVAGEISGNITIKEDLDVKSTSKINGDIKVSELAIEKGAEINGKITMTEKATVKETLKPLAKEEALTP